jgi:hypothetical protein
MRATRDLLRRRNFLMRKRAELITHIEITNAQYNLPPFDKKLAHWKNRQDVAERFADPSVQTSMQLDVDRMDVYDQILNEVELELTRTAKAHACPVVPPAPHHPGRGQDSLADPALRNPRHPPLPSRAGLRLVLPPGEVLFSEMVTLFLREVPRAKTRLQRLESKHGEGKALSILACNLGRTVYFMLRRNEAFDVNQFFAS